MQRVVVVGGGVLGMMHAIAARRRGYQVVQLESSRHWADGGRWCEF